MACATTATILWTGDVNDPVWASERSGRVDEGLPIITAPGCEDLRATRAAIFLRRLVHIETGCAFHENPWSVCACQCHLDASATTRAACLGSCGDGRWLTIIRFGMVVAIAIIPGNLVLVLWSVP